MFTIPPHVLQRPNAFTPSEGSIWTNEHISKNMLQAHLDPSFEGATRNHRFIDKSAAFISTMAGPRIIDFGCGPGLYTERFAKLGHNVTGLDISSRSIAYAKAHDNQSTYYVHDYLQPAPTEMLHDFATLIYCDYGALSKENRKTLLHNLKQTLTSGGQLFLDVFSMHQYGAFEEAMIWEHHPSSGFWSSEPHLTLTQNTRYTKNITLEQTVVATEEETVVHYIWNEYFTLEQLEQELTDAGFLVEKRFDDVAGSTYTGQAPTIAILARVDNTRS
ncbi:hypothetical protein DH09_17920 [Bacillaceae bacterium JMAK1]|nr:hypothetical protein DH09_17920 [Bacillaceae bacterium JMAK1]